MKDRTVSIASLELSEFVQATEATRDGDRWTICCDPSHNPPRGMIHDCEGETEFEAKENAYYYLQALQAELGR